MIKKFRMFILVGLLLCLFISPVYAINMDLSANASNTVVNTVNDSTTANTITDTNTISDTNTLLSTSTNSTLTSGSLTPNSSSTNTGISYINSLPEADLGLNNVLNILLIVIGILLILLGIAIIIRLK